jgi:hypothetical protein
MTKTPAEIEHDLYCAKNKLPFPKSRLEMLDARMEHFRQQGRRIDRLRPPDPKPKKPRRRIQDIPPAPPGGCGKTRAVSVEDEHQRKQRMGALRIATAPDGRRVPARPAGRRSGHRRGEK